MAQTTQPGAINLYLKTTVPSTGDWRESSRHVAVWLHYTAGAFLDGSKYCLVVHKKRLCHLFCEK